MFSVHAYFKGHRKIIKRRIGANDAVRRGIITIFRGETTIALNALVYS
jgi:hypothetical protein